LCPRLFSFFGGVGAGDVVVEKMLHKISGVFCAFTANYPDALDEGAKHTAYLVKHFLDNNITRADTTEEAEQAWTQEVHGTKAVTIMGGTACTPGYYNLEGKHDPRARYNQPYGGMLGSNRYFAKLEAFREGDKLPGLVTS